MGLLRLLLALSVVATHAGAILGTPLVGGQIAVQVFYIISGFYMTLILNEKYVGINDSYRLFITNRLLKLFPIYWTILFLILLLSAASLLVTHGAFAGKVNAYFQYNKNYGNMDLFTLIYLVLTNFFLVGQDLAMFLGLDRLTGALFFTKDFHQTDPQLSSFLLVPQAWTLGLEITFYLIAPFIVRRSLKLIFVLIILSFSLRLFLIYKGLDFDPWSYRFFPTELMFFLLGAVSYKLYLFIKKHEPPKWVSYGALFLVVSQTIFFTFYNFPHKDILYFLSCFLVIPIAFYITKNLKWDYMLGELSYPVYIAHMLLFYAVMNDRFPKLQSPGTTLAICVIIFAVLLNRFVAMPVEKYRQNRLQ